MPSSASPSTLMPVAEALEKLLSGVTPRETETAPLLEANKRVLASDLSATRSQPPFHASAMDGYAVRSDDLADMPTELDLIGQAPAGHGFEGTVSSGQAVRIFTGAPLPDGADTVVIQENTERPADGKVRILSAPKQGANIRAAGLDFKQGDVLLSQGHRLDFRSLSLAASMNHPDLAVIRKPRVAILATGDELVTPGGTPGPDQIIASNQIGIAALVEDCGGVAIDLGIATDDNEAIAAKVRQALDLKADVLVTLGGASVGDHDLVQDVLGGQGMDLAFWKIAMRPGKPLMAGTIGDTKVLGLPGNPVSSLVCALLFLKPLLLRMLGTSGPETGNVITKHFARLEKPLKANDRRQDYVRAELTVSEDGTLSVRPFDLQDSSLLGLFSRSSALIIRPPHADAADTGDTVQILPVSFL